MCANKNQFTFDKGKNILGLIVIFVKGKNILGWIVRYQLTNIYLYSSPQQRWLLSVEIKLDVYLKKNLLIGKAFWTLF